MEQQRRLSLLNVELAAAVNQSPVDVGRLRKAAEARDLYRDQMDRETTAQTVAILQQLPAQDRGIFARQLDLNILRVILPSVNCKVP